MKYLSLVSFAVASLMFSCNANAQGHVNIGSGAAPRPLVMNKIITEPALEADNAMLAPRRHPVMTISIRNRWRFDCYAPASAKECAEAAAIVQKAYADLGSGPLLSGTRYPSGFGTPKWQTTCYLGPNKCETVINRLQAVNTHKE